MASTSKDLKLVLVGSAGVGKTCCVRMATTGFFDQNSNPTLGASFTAKMVKYEGQSYRLQIWDTAGQERYKSMAPMYFRGAHAALIVYSIIDKSSFDAVDEWANALRSNGEPNVKVFLAGNKLDCEEEREVSTEAGEAKAAEIGAYFAEISAKTGANIEDLFAEIPIEVLSKGLKEETKAKITENKKRGGCC